MKDLLKKSTFIANVFFGLSYALFAKTKPEILPNVIIFLTDDQGYQDVGCFGSPLIKTPNLDQMAHDGMRFTDFYSASSVCSPSRAALLTGCYPPRVGVPVVLWPGSENGLNGKEVTLAEMLKERGYSTACIGKWHLGDLPEYLPCKQGFDQYLGIPYSNDMSINPTVKVAKDAVFREGMSLDSIRNGKPHKYKVPLMRNDEVVVYPVDQTTLTNLYTKETIQFIREKKDSPFFIYLAHSMPHIPLNPSPEFRGRSARGLYGDVIEEIDWSIGEILRTLKELDLEKNTLVVFTSDNGPWNLKNGDGGSALPLRGFKFDTYEGGMRVPMIAYWEGKIPAGRECSEIVSMIDLFPTIAFLSHSNTSDNAIDGKNVWPLMSGQKGAISPHKDFYYYSDTILQAVRSGKWKLRIVKGEIELFNLEKDISESTSIAIENPEVVEKMHVMMEKFDKNLKLNSHK